MKATHSLSTSRTLFLLGAVLFAQCLRAQEVYSWEPWLSSRNQAGLVASSAPRHITSGSFIDAEAQLYGGFTSGDFRSLSDAKLSWNTGATASAQAYFPDMLLLGDFSFDLMGGDNMQGSMFTTPGYYPIDIYEFTPGRKTRQTYSIGGGAAWLNKSRFIPSATVRFKGVNYSKRKDLRHTTYRQEVEAVPSLLYDGGAFRLGLSYIFLKTSEYVKAEQIGAATADSYYAFLDKGLMYGTYQVWNGSGTHLAEAGVDRLPVKEISHGVSLQAEVGEWLYADVEYNYSKGEVGEKGYTWFRFPGHRLAANLQGTIHTASGVHVVRLEYDWKGQQTHETVLERVTTGGVTVPEEHGSNRIFERREMHLKPSWKAYFDSGLEVGVWALYSHTVQLSSLVYPYEYHDAARHLTIGGELNANLGPFELESALQLGTKIGEHVYSVDNVDPSLGLLTAPYCLSEWRQAMDELSDVTQMTARLCLRYPFAIARKYHLYVQAACTLTSAFGVIFLPGDKRQETLVTLGYKF